MDGKLQNKYIGLGEQLWGHSSPQWGMNGLMVEREWAQIATVFDGMPLLKEKGIWDGGFRDCFQRVPSRRLPARISPVARLGEDAESFAMEPNPTGFRQCPGRRGGKNFLIVRGESETGASWGGRPVGFQ